MNGDQPAEAEKPPLDTADGGSSNGADAQAKKRKKDSLKPIITTEDSPQQSQTEDDVSQQNKQADKSGCVNMTTLYFFSFFLFKCCPSFGFGIVLISFILTIVFQLFVTEVTMRLLFLSPCFNRKRCEVTFTPRSSYLRQGSCLCRPSSGSATIICMYTAPHPVCPLKGLRSQEAGFVSFGKFQRLHFRAAVHRSYEEPVLPPCRASQSQFQSHGVWCVCLMAGLMRGLTVRIEHDTKLSAVISSVNL